MKRKVLKMNDSGHQYEVIHNDEEKCNPYSVVKVWYDFGWHRKTIIKYADLKNVMCFLAETV